MITLRFEGHGARFLRDGAALTPPLPLHPLALVETCLRHDPPTALELETAIETIEDIVMPLHRKWPADGDLQVDGLAPQDSFAGLELDRAGLELLFDRAAAIAQGRPRSSDPELARPLSMAMLLIVREVMHHLGFTGVRFSR